GAAVAQHLEVQVGARRPARAAHAGDDLPAGDLVAYGDEVVGVVRVAGRVPVAVIDFDELAVTVPLAGPGNDAGRDGDDVRALPAGEIDALVECAAPGERVVAVAESRRDVARRDRPPFRMDLVRELAVQQEVLE